jgi:hypothetical protein
MAKNHGRVFTPTVESDQRRVDHKVVYKYTKKRKALELVEKVRVFQCNTTCECALPRPCNISSLPFDDTIMMDPRIKPGKMPRFSELLGSLYL